jgi:hypothetical protein
MLKEAYTATHSRNRGLVELLIDRGADIHAEGGQFGTALLAACLGLDSEAIANFLLEKGADANIQGGEHGNALNTMCFSRRWEDILYGRQHALADWRLDPISLGLLDMLDSGAKVNEPCGRYGTALQAACQGCAFYMVSMLLDRGVEVNVQGGMYGTAVQATCATRYKFPLGILRLLVEHGADVHAQGGFYGSAWHAAAARFHGDCDQMLQQLLDLGVDINDARGRQHPTALHAAFEVGAGFYICRRAARGIQGQKSMQQSIGSAS